MEKHSCRVCGRCFPSGRSLGGHMRSHVVMNSSMNAEENPGSRYGLRDNPRKSRRFADGSPEKEKDKLCAKLEKRLSSLNSSSEMPGDELNQEDEDDLWSRGYYEEEEEEMQTQSDSEVTVISMLVRKQRRRSRRVAAISDSSSLPDSSPEYDKEEEDGALCLLMLSRGASSVTDSSDKTSPRIGFGMNELKKVHSFPSDDGVQEFKKPKASSFSSDADHGDISSTVLEFGKRSLPNQCNSESGMDNSGKRSRYECTICNKSFHSYQALGGHCASHKRMKGDNQEESQTVGRSPEYSRCHECSICGKVFASGQALGGHKRSHLVIANNSASAVGADTVHAYPVLIEIGQKASKLNSIDLNLPAPDNEY